MDSPAKTIRQLANLLAIGEWDMLRMHTEYCLDFASDEYGNAHHSPAECRMWLARCNAFETILALIDRLEALDE